MIIVKLQGGLGNQMFQYATGKALSIKHKTPLFLDHTFIEDRTPRKDFVYRNYDLDIFNLKAERASNKELKDFFSPLPKWNKISFQKTRDVYQVITEPNFLYNPELVNKKGNLYLDGYWQSPSYFNAVATEIGNDFQFKNPVSSGKEKELLSEIETNDSVMINIRRTDYLTEAAQTLLGNVRGIEYINQGIELLRSKIKNPKFYIFSDDIEWCKKHIRLENSFIVDHSFAGNKFSNYLQLMISCHHFIIPNSTFAWWSAWLAPYNSKVIIAPKNWFATEPINIVPPEWIKI